MININPHNLGNYIVPEEVRNGICIDIGANVGSFIKKYYEFFDKIYFYEPITECFNVCKKFADSLPTKIIGQNKAVWHTSNQKVVILSHRNNDSGSCAISSEILNDEWSPNNSFQEIDTITLDDIYQQVGQNINYCKIDCETSEYHILLNKNLSKINYIGMELHYQIGLKRLTELVIHIQKTHTLVSGKIPTKNYNTEVLFKNNEIL
jgi:FkbM family methyltransferase